MKGFEIRKMVPYLIAVAAFILLAYGYAPQVLKGKIVNQSDISSWEGMSREIVSHNQAHPDDRTLWTNSMFGGMPATTISVIYEGDYTQPVYDLFFTGERPASYLLISLIGGFLLMLAFGADIYLAFLGAVAISFCSYNMQIIQVGHNTKMIAIAFMPWVLAAVVYAYRKNALPGALLFAFALSFQIKANHPQITYYLAIIIAGYGIYQLCSAVREKTFPRFLKTSLLLLVAGGLGIAANTNHLWPTYEYARHTMRGGTELSGKDSEAILAEMHSGSAAAAAPAVSGNGDGSPRKSRKGLDLEYATAWSYGIEETPNLFIPNFNGGASAGALTRKSATYQVLKENRVAGADQMIRQLPLYWGPQPFTAGPMYMGALCVFLFVLSFFILRNGLRWWIGGVGLLALLLGWGSHMMFVSELFFNWAPMYNKFRTVSMILVVLQLLIPIAGVLTIRELLNPAVPAEKRRVRRGFAWSAGITAGFALLCILFPSLMGDFSSAADAGMPPVLADALAADRITLLRTDAFRSLIFILAGAAVLWAGYLRKLKPHHTVLILIALVTIDLWGIDKRYLNDSHFVTRREFKNAFALRPADKEILKDTDPNYRVLDLSVNTFNDAYVSYHHKTVGGYSPAKMQRYQDLIERNIAPEMQAVSQEISASGAATLAQAQQALSYHPVLSMLNTRYIVLNAEMPPLVNPYALGNAWFVQKIVPAADADQEIALLSRIDPAHTAVVSESFLQRLPGLRTTISGVLPEKTDSAESAAAGKEQDGTPESGAAGVADSSAFIRLISYAPNRLVYRYESAIPRIALFSEVYYPGWNVRLIPDESGSGSTPAAGEKPEIFRADYILRGLSLPAGRYDIEFTFDPESFRKGETISRIASGLLYLLLAGSIAGLIVRRKKREGSGTPAPLRPENSPVR